MKHIIILVAALLLLGACNKEDAQTPSTPQQTSDLTIELKTPANHTEIQVDCDTTLVIYISDALSLHEYTVEIVGSDEVQYFYTEGHTHFSEITLQEAWINTAPAGIELNLIVKATNHAGELLTRTFQFYSKP